MRYAKGIGWRVFAPAGLAVEIARRIRSGARVLTLVALVAAGPAMAAGGAHVIDDAAVEAPGTCHLESWVTHDGNGDGIVNLGPACTTTALPTLELGGFVQQTWRGGMTAIGLAPKVTLRPETSGLGIGLSGSLGYGIDRKHFETGSVIVPLTVPLTDRVRFNIDLGWQWARAGDVDTPFVGAQAEIALVRDLALMVEGFTRTTGKPGAQTGLRWTPHAGPVDVDLLAGRYLDGRTHSAVTLGVTLRH